MPSAGTYSGQSSRRTPWLTNSPPWLPYPFLNFGAKYRFRWVFDEVKPLYLLPRTEYIPVKQEMSTMHDHCALHITTPKKHQIQPPSNFHSKDLSYRGNWKCRPSVLCTCPFHSLFRTSEPLALLSLSSTYVFTCRHKKKPSYYYEGVKNTSSYINRLRNKKHQQFRQNHIWRFVFHIFFWAGVMKKRKKCLGNI